ncbi:hypothetical protein R6Q57_028147 [Mikania cordata]
MHASTTISSVFQSFRYGFWSFQKKSAVSYSNMALKLYGSVNSEATQRVQACLHEKEVDFEFTTVNTAAGEHKTPRFLARNPFGEVPALEDGDVTLFGNRLIEHYEIDELLLILKFGVYYRILLRAQYWFICYRIKSNHSVHSAQIRRKRNGSDIEGSD